MVIQRKEGNNEEQRRQAKAKGKATASQSRSRKGKGIATEPSDKSSSGSDRNEDRASRKKGSDKQKGKATEERPVRIYTKAQLKERILELEKERNLTFVATRYPDPMFLTEAGLLEDVEAIFDNMGLARLLSVPCDTYVDLTKEFIMTLRVNKPADFEGDEVGYIEFSANRKKYKVSYAELSDIYGLPRGHRHHIEGLPVEQTLVWREIGTGAYAKGLTKSANIRHPAIRYAHKAIAHTFYARRETGTIKEGDMKLLMVGIKPFLGPLCHGREIDTTREDVSIVGMFVFFLKYIQEWIMVTEDKTPQISMGGLLTPLFGSLGVELTGKRLPIAWMDIHYLYRTHYICGVQGPFYGYKFQHVSKVEKKFLLPNIPRTHLNLEENVRFQHADDVWYDVTRDGELVRLEKPKEPTPAEPPAALAPGPDDQPPPRAHIYGSARYEFQPWDEPIPPRQTALQAAHKHINLLQRLCKWQGRTLKKVVNQVKHLTREVRELKGGCSNTRRDDVVDTGMAPREEEDIPQDDMEATGENTDNPMDEDARMRHSFDGVPEATDDQGEPARASSFEPRQRRRKRRATRSPTPPAPASSNESYSFGSDTWY